MFNKLSLFVLAAPLVNAITLNIPKGPVSGGPVTISWSFDPTDPNFSLELTNEQFHNAFAIGNNISPTAGSIDITLPIVPIGDGYTLQAVNVGNINQVYAQTGDFAIAANPSASPLSSTASSTSGSSSSSASNSVTAKTTLSVSAPTHSTTSTSFGVTVSASSPSGTATSPASSGASSATGSVTTQAAPAATTLNGALSNLKVGGNMGTLAVALLSGFAGVAVVLL